MSYDTVLQQLFPPVEIGGDFSADLTADARTLDRADARATQLLLEIFPDTAAELITSWERYLALTPKSTDTLQQRQQRCVNKLRARGGLSRPYFISLAESMGYTVEIVEEVPAMAGWLEAGDELFDESIVAQWGVKIMDHPLYYFRAGSSTAGEQLLSFTTATELETLFQKLKPAHTSVYFIYED